MIILFCSIIVVLFRVSHSSVQETVSKDWAIKLDIFYEICRGDIFCRHGAGNMGLKMFDIKPPQSLQALMLHEIFKVIQPTSYYYVEFGFDAANFRGGGGANVGYMKYVLNWSGLLMDGGHANEELNLKKEFIYPENVAELFEKYDVPKDVDFVSIDIDSADVLVLDALLSSGKYRPKVMSIEYQCYFPWESTLANVGYSIPSGRNGTTPYRERTPYFWHGERFFGTALKNVYDVAVKHGYSVVGVDTGYDVFIVRNDLIPGVTIHPYEHWKKATSKHTVQSFTRERENHGGRSDQPYGCWCMGHRQKHKTLRSVEHFLVNYALFSENGGNAEAASGVHTKQLLAKGNLGFQEMCFHGASPSGASATPELQARSLGIFADKSYLNMKQEDLFKIVEHARKPVANSN